MMDILNGFIDNNTFPVLTALLLGVLTSISPCPLATNIAAVAYLSKGSKTAKKVLLSGFFYAFGRAISYTLLAVLIYYGFSVFMVSKSMQSWGERLLGPLLILAGLAMMNVAKIKLPNFGGRLERTKQWLTEKGELGAFILGAGFALAFCPYSAVLFFGAFIPLVLETSGGLLLPPVFALGTGLPVIFFSFLIVFGAQKIGKVFRATQTVDKYMRYTAALIFICAGVYYLRFMFGL